jgi:CysZ protein
VGVIGDFGKALGQLGDPRFLRALFGALAITVAALAALSWLVVLGLGWLLPDSVSLPWIGEVGFVDDVVSWAAVAVMLVLSVVLMVPTAAAVVGFFLDGIAAAVEARHYPALPPATELGFGEQVADAARFFGLVVAVNLLALVVYLLVPPFAPFVFWLVNGFLLGREYFQLVAMRRLGRAAADGLRRRHFWRIWLAGTAMAVPMSVPVLNLLVPILGVAVFTHQFHRLAPEAQTYS